jgi:predicted nucleic acid-binding protein
MPERIIADTSVLIIFDRIDRFDILKGVYQEIYTTPEVAGEFMKPLPEWIKIIPVKDEKYQAFLETQLDIGEASVIALATEDDNNLLILDDLKARKLAARLGIKITGTLGILTKAKSLGIIKNIRPVIENLKTKEFRISEVIVKSLLIRNGE